MTDPADTPNERASAWQRLSLRWRLMAIGLGGLALALGAAGVILYAALASSLPRALADEAARAAAEVATLADQGRLPDPVPVSGAQVVQVLDRHHRVVAGSALADRLTPMLTEAELAGALAGERVVVPGSRSGLGGHLLVAAQTAGPASARSAVVAAVPTGDAETTLAQVRTLLLIAFPLLLVVLAVIAWRVIGSALAPVEQLRRGAERIGAAGGWGAGGAATERLPMPAARDEIHALATTLNDMLSRLDQLQARQRRFLTDAAHELRSPLASLLTQLEVAERVGDGGGLPAELLPEVRRLTRLVEDLLVLARTGSEAGPPRVGAVELDALVREIAGRYAAARVPVTVDIEAVGSVKTLESLESVESVESVDTAGAVDPVGVGEAADAAAGEAAGSPADLGHPGAARAVRIEGSRAARAVTVNRDEVHRAVANLVDNAVRHAHSRVVLRLTDQGTAGVWLHVVDDGRGIPQAQLERVFDRFTRLDEARDRDSGGSGLGLPIARELLRRNGAELTLRSAEPGVDAVVRWPASP